MKKDYVREFAHLPGHYVLRSLPHNYIFFAPDPPRFTMVEISDCFLEALKMTRDYIIGKSLFDVFPDNPNSSVKNEAALMASLMKVVNHKIYDAMPIVRYDIPGQDANKFNVRYWSPENYPMLDKNGQLLFIMHTAIDVSDILRKGMNI